MMQSQKGLLTLISFINTIQNECKKGILMRALVSCPFADIFDIPDNNQPRSDELLYGTLVEILAVLPGSWYKIRTFYRYEGFIQGKNLLALSDWQKICRKRLNPPESKIKIIKKRCCDILKNPDVKSSLLCSLVKGSYICLYPEQYSENQRPTSLENGYCRVILYDGRIGYCKNSCLTSCPNYSKNLPAEENIFREKVTRTALFYLDTQYRWGGKSPLGIDCSGLTFMSYLLNGVLIYRDARMEPEFPVHPIAPDQKRPGDLLYFPGHIAMYLGNDQYIHSTAHPGSDGVVINSLNPLSSNYREDLHHCLTGVGSIF